jgi:hypothetical protein
LFFALATIGEKPAPDILLTATMASQLSTNYCYY